MSPALKLNSVTCRGCKLTTHKKAYTVIECLSRFMENVAILALAYEPFPILSKVDLNIQMFLLLKLFRADLNNFSKLDGNQNTMFF